MIGRKCFTEMIVNEVPEHAERLDENERCHDEQCDDADSIGR